MLVLRAKTTFRDDRVMTTYEFRALVIDHGSLVAVSPENVTR
jgi:hypothetical protein